MCHKGARPVSRRINRNASKGRPVRSDQPETRRGTFEVISSTLVPVSFVAVEKCWMNDMWELAAGMQDYGDHVEAYVDTRSASTAVEIPLLASGVAAARSPTLLTTSSWISSIWVDDS